MNMMYTPKHFQQDTKQATEIMRGYGFATLLSIKDGAPLISHLPFLYDESQGPFGILVAHMARAKPQWRLFKDNPAVTVIFQGPHAYVSPRWYEFKADNVPTWNYAVVHAHGNAKVIADPEQAYLTLQKLVQHHDGEWTLDLSEKDRQEMLNEIVVFQIEVTKLDCKFKLSQNRSNVDQANVAKHLAQSQHQDERETAALMARLQAARPI